MKSSHKFPSGLNNWVDSDKPVRADFVADNKTLDENVLWKNVYDPDDDVARAGGISGYVIAATDYDNDGSVKTAGGISNYAMDKTTYDPTGAVAQAGGITAAIAQNDGFTIYTHSKSDSIHTLSAENGGPNVKFTATADYVLGDTFFINGATCDAKMINGSPLTDHYFTNGSIVSCFLNGGTLFFNVGDNTNYGVIAVASSSELPAMARENTIAIVTGIPVTDHTFDKTAPTIRTDGSPLAGGEVWIAISYKSLVPFNAQKRSSLWVYPANPKQYNGTEWVPVQASIYQLGQWKSFDVFYVDGGQLIGGVSLILSYGIGNIVQQSDYIELSNTAGDVTYFSIGMQPLDGIGKIRAVIEAKTSYCYTHVAISASSSSNEIADTKIAHTPEQGPVEFVVDTSGIHGAYYLNVALQPAGSTVKLSLWKGESA